MPALAQGIYKAIRVGLDPIIALQISSLNAALAGLPDGSFLPGRIPEGLLGSSLNYVGEVRQGI